LFTSFQPKKSSPRSTAAQAVRRINADSSSFRPTSNVRIRPRTALVASADRSFRQRLTQILTGLRWQVREAEGGAQAWADAQSSPRKRSSSIPGCPISIWPSFSRTSERLSPGGPGGRRRRLGAGEPARSLSSGTALCPAPLPGHRYGGLECGARAHSTIERAAHRGQSGDGVTLLHGQFPPLSSGAAPRRRQNPPKPFRPSVRLASFPNQGPFGSARCADAGSNATACRS
jgi:hypothetical protein